MPSARVVGFRAIERRWLGSLRAARATALAGLQTPNVSKNLNEVLRAAELQGHNVYKLAVREYTKEGETRYALELSTFEGKKQIAA